MYLHCSIWRKLPSLRDDDLVGLDNPRRIVSRVSDQCRRKRAGLNRYGIFANKLLFLFWWTQVAPWAMLSAIRCWFVDGTGNSDIAVGQSNVWLS